MIRFAKWLAMRALFGALVCLPAMLSASATEPGPRAVLARYFSLINQRNFHQAFHVWEIDQGRNAAGQTEAQFTAGFAHTRRVIAEIGREGEGDGAAGSIYTTLDVSLTAQTSAGRVQHFSGQYTLRMSNVPGGHRDWEIYSAKMVLLR